MYPLVYNLLIYLIMLPSQLKPSRGFGILELMVAMGLAAILALGAYRMVGSSNRETLVSIGKTQIGLSGGKMMDGIADYLKNVPPVFGNDLGHRLRVSTNDSPSVQVASAIALYPGYSYEDMKNISVDNGVINPSVIDITTINGKSDAIRFITLSPEANAYDIADDPSDGMPVDVRDYAAVLIKGETNLEKGDFVLLSDRNSSVLIRVTQISTSTVDGKTITSLEHHSSASSGSIWNASITHDYGVSSSGTVLPERASVQKVNVYTFAYSMERKSIMKFDHKYDDGFDPVQKQFNVTMGEAGWSELMQGVDQLQITYVYHDPVMETRVPLVLQNSNPLIPIKSEAGQAKGLRQVLIEATIGGKKMKRMLNPYERSGSTGCVGCDTLAAESIQGGTLAVIGERCPEGYHYLTGEMPTGNSCSCKEDNSCSLTPLNPGPSGHCCDDFNNDTCTAKCVYFALGGGEEANGDTIWSENPGYGGGGT